MTLDKNAIRAMLEEWFEDYNPNHRFELDIGKNTLSVTAQQAKVRIPHKTQKGLERF